MLGRAALVKCGNSIARFCAVVIFVTKKFHAASGARRAGDGKKRAKSKAGQKCAGQSDGKAQREQEGYGKNCTASAPPDGRTQENEEKFMEF